MFKGFRGMKAEVQGASTCHSSRRPRPKTRTRHNPLGGGEDRLRNTFLSQVLEFLDTALPKDSLSGPDSSSSWSLAPLPSSILLHALGWRGWGRRVLWGVKASCVPVEGSCGLPKAAVPTPLPNPSPVSCLHSSPSSQATSLGEQLPEPGAFHWGSASSTGFMFQVSGTWHRAAQGPGHRVNIPALSGGTHPPRCPCLDKAMYLGMS